MKAYLVSLLAVKDLEWNDEGFNELPAGSYMESVPAFLPAESMEEAAEKARVYMLERWKPEEGWHTHKANIMVLTQAQINPLIGALRAGVLDLSDEEPRSFDFSV